MTRLLTLLIAVLLAGSALAQEARPPPFDPGIYPPEVRRAVRYGNEECAGQGGGEVIFAPDTVRKVDLTGDGRDDYIVDFHNTECKGRAAVYCGTGGCTMEILVTLPNGKVRSVFNDRVRYYEVLPGEGARTIHFELHGSFCSGHGNPSCIRGASDHDQAVRVQGAGVIGPRWSPRAAKRNTRSDDMPARPFWIVLRSIRVTADIHGLHRANRGSYLPHQFLS